MKPSMTCQTCQTACQTATKPKNFNKKPHKPRPSAAVRKLVCVDCTRKFQNQKDLKAHQTSKKHGVYK